jgi:hypothetical protein
MHIEIRHRLGPRIFGILVLIPLCGAAAACLVAFVFPLLPGFLRLKTAAVATIVFILLFACYWLVKDIFSRQPALTITSDGITNRSGFSNTVFIPWGDIAEFREAVNSMRQKLLLVIVNNPASYISKGSAMTARFRQNYLATFGTPIVISALNLNIDFSELVGVLNHALKDHRAG